MAEVIVEVPVEIISHLRKDTRYPDPVGRAALIGCHSQECTGEVDLLVNDVRARCAKLGCEVIAAGADGIVRTVVSADAQQTRAEAYGLMPKPKAVKPAKQSA